MNEDKVMNEYMDDLFDSISKFNKTAYMHRYMLSNPVANKNIPYVDHVLSQRNNGIGRFSVVVIFEVLANIVKYYIKSFAAYFVFIIEFIIYKSTMQKVILDDPNGAICVDVWVNVSKYQQDGRFYDKYFSGLYEVLDKRKLKYYFIPRFYNKKFKFIEIYRMFRFFKKNSVPVMSIYQLTTVIDFYKLLRFIVCYPYIVISSARKEKVKSALMVGFKYELITSIRDVTMYSYQQYLYGNNIANLGVKKIVSWYENQTTDKNLYAGLNKSADDVYIYGCQLYIVPKSLISYRPVLSDVKFGIVPNKVLVNGKHYLNEMPDINNYSGPSLRYRRLFNVVSEGGAQKDTILILLSYFSEQIRVVLEVVSRTKVSGRKFVVKFHPATNIPDYVDSISSNLIISEDNLYDLLEEAKIVIGSATGSLVEAAALSIPSIVIEDGLSITHDYFDGYGKGVIWEFARTSYDVEKLLSEYEDKLLSNEYVRALDECSEYLLENYFTEPSEAKIIDAFDL